MTSVWESKTRGITIADATRSSNVHKIQAPHITKSAIRPFLLDIFERQTCFPINFLIGWFSQLIFEIKFALLREFMKEKRKNFVIYHPIRPSSPNILKSCLRINLFRFKTNRSDRTSRLGWMKKVLNAENLFPFSVIETTLYLLMKSPKHRDWSKKMLASSKFPINSDHKVMNSLKTHANKTHISPHLLYQRLTMPRWNSPG